MSLALKVLFKKLFDHYYSYEGLCGGCCSLCGATGFKPYLVHCCWKGVLYLLRHNYLGTNHRHLTEIDCSSAVVGGLAAGSEFGANQYTGPACGAKKCFIAPAAAGNITTTVNKGRWAGPMSSLLLLDVYGTNQLQNGRIVNSSL